MEASKRAGSSESARPRGRPSVIDRDQLARLWADGVPASEIGETLGVTREAVHRAVKRHGLPLRGRARPAAVLVPDRKLAKLRRQMTIDELAEHLEVSRRTVERRLRAAGLS